MLKRWLTGWDLRDRWKITQADLADMILSGELVAFESETHSPLDVQDERDYISYLYHNPNAPERALIPTLIEKAITLSFRFSDVAEFEKQKGIAPHETPSAQVAQTMETTVQEPETPTSSDIESVGVKYSDQTGAADKKQALSVSDYIEQQRTAGEKDEVIAAKLYDKKGTFKQTYANIARLLGKNDELNENQHDALKKRGKRLCDKGKNILKNL